MDDTTLALSTTPGLPAPDYGAAGRYLAQLAPTGMASMRSALSLAARLIGLANYEDVPWNQLTADKIKMLARTAANTPTERGKPRAPASVAAMVSAVKGACRAAWDAETLSTDAWERIRKVSAPAGARLAAGREVGAGEKVSLFRSAAGDDGPTGARDAAMLAVLMGTGLRRAELTYMQFEDFDSTTGRATVIGKRNKEREIWLAPGSIDALIDWLEIRGRGPGPLFCPIRKGGQLALDQFLGLSSVSYIIERRRKLAGVAKFTPHDLRRTFAGDMLDAGEDLATVQATMGHTDPRTTSRYDRRGSRTRRAAAQKIDVPYKPRRRVQSKLV